MNDLPGTPDRDRIAAEYFELLPFSPYPVQEEALLAWFTSQQGVLVCAPTGTGKTLIAEAAIYEALRTGTRAYYTTPLIALTDQKLRELRESVVRWGFPASSVGLVTGNRRVNADAPILVVVAEILLNRLLIPEQFDFTEVGSVVMDEFHSFNDPERGIVWELTLALLPPHVRTLLLSATVGNSYEFTSWLRRSCQRDLQLVESTERKVPLRFQWIDDHLLDEWVEKMAEGDEAARRTPALIFCFNREECWQTAELLKGRRIIDKSRQAAILEQLERFDWSQGAGPKLKQLLGRGVGVHHAGMLPKYRRIVEDLFQQKLLSVCVCTETLSAGINLPARSVVLPSLMRGPRDRRRLIDVASAQQIFGRAGRPQYDSEGFVYALAHEDDVKLLRWREKYDQIPEDTKDPGLLRAKKALKKKMPRRRQGEVYWTAEHFEKLQTAAAANLSSKGDLPWRLLAYILLKSPEVERLRQMVARRLLNSTQIERAQVRLNEMLITLWAGGYVELEPKPKPKTGKKPEPSEPSPHQSSTSGGGLLEAAGLSSLVEQARQQTGRVEEEATIDSSAADRGYDVKNYRPEFARPTERLATLVQLRSVNPLYGAFLAGHLAIADDTERLLALESVLEMPRSVARYVHVPGPEQLPPGPLARERLDHQLLQLGLATQEELTGKSMFEDAREEDDEGEQRRRRGRGLFREERVYALTLAEKLRRLFNHDFPNVHDVVTVPVHVAGEVLEFGGDFNKYIVAKKLQKQEGIIFRHLLRLVLLLDEMACIPPAETTVEQWEDRLDSLIVRLTECCRRVDPESTDEALEVGRGGDDLASTVGKKR